MGKTPGKWFKNLLLGKKSSKSNLSKGREVLKPSNKGEQLVSSKLSNVTSEAPIISPPIVGTITGNEIDSDNEVVSKLQSEEVVLSNVKEGGSTTQAAAVSAEDPERIRLEQAATKAQAAFRGYVARREFQTLKCIIMLQSHVRGHLVRRQAVSTLCCVKGIVKFQAIVRARKDSKVSAATKFRRLSKKIFVFKLLASLPTAIPLRLQYGSGEPNSASLWLERWSRSHFWEPLSEPKKNPDSKSRRSGEDKSKKSVRRMSGANAENGSACSTLDSEKGKRNSKKVSSQPVNSAHERSPIEIEKIKRSSRKTPDPTKEVSDRSEVDIGKPKHRMRKPLGAAAPAISEQGANDSAEKSKDIPVASPKQSDIEKDMELDNADNSVGKLDCQSPLDLQPMENIGKTEDIQELNQQLGSKDDSVLNDNPKTSQRRASLPAKFEPQENGSQNTPKLPSYMAPTESAKAKLRGQGSPRFSRDAVEKNVLLRRHSLSSSTNSMLSSLSPRAHKLVQATGRGAIRGDRSLSSSRDGGDKLIQAEWRR
ncbi:protein IQ-DOMAIN 31 [Morus notabilis]|uniref:protein IQ-DOMAIN 31 n=1 Tax=Morus notabilis TaxID=981085 RepID=UPI000CED052A|nr:protein IQ-DOMAIN 31 [Morus notabilis]XP_024021362.1 protein IQ-DOMAIN 31 [Morus notabilis]